MGRIRSWGLQASEVLKGVARRSVPLDMRRPTSCGAELRPGRRALLFVSAVGRVPSDAYFARPTTEVVTAVRDWLRDADAERRMTLLVELAQHSDPALSLSALFRLSHDAELASRLSADQRRLLLERFQTHPYASGVGVRVDAYLPG